MFYTCEETSAQVKIAPAVVALVITGRASIMPKYQVTNPVFLEEEDNEETEEEEETSETPCFLWRKGDRM